MPLERHWTAVLFYPQEVDAGLVTLIVARVKEAGYEVVDWQQLNAPNSSQGVEEPIITQIIANVTANTCRRIVAVLHDDQGRVNHNVLFEMGFAHGYAHGLKKAKQYGPRLIPIVRDDVGKSLPFNIQGYRYITYTKSALGISNVPKLEGDLDAQLQQEPIEQHRARQIVAYSLLRSDAGVGKDAKAQLQIRVKEFFDKLDPIENQKSIHRPQLWEACQRRWISSLKEIVKTLGTALHEGNSEPDNAWILIWTDILKRCEPEECTDAALAASEHRLSFIVRRMSLIVNVRAPIRQYFSLLTVAQSREIDLHLLLPVFRYVLSPGVTEKDAASTCTLAGLLFETAFKQHSQFGETIRERTRVALREGLKQHSSPPVVGLQNAIVRVRIQASRIHDDLRLDLQRHLQTDLTPSSLSAAEIQRIADDTEAISSSRVTNIAIFTVGTVIGLVLWGITVSLAVYLVGQSVDKASTEATNSLWLKAFVEHAAPYTPITGWSSSHRLGDVISGIVVVAVFAALSRVSRSWRSSFTMFAIAMLIGIALHLQFWWQKGGIEVIALVLAVRFLVFSRTPVIKTVPGCSEHTEFQRSLTWGLVGGAAVFLASCLAIPLHDQEFHEAIVQAGVRALAMFFAAFMCTLIALSPGVRLWSLVFARFTPRAERVEAIE